MGPIQVGHEWLHVGRIVALRYNALGFARSRQPAVARGSLHLVGKRPDRRAASAIRLRDLPQFPLIIPSRPHAIRMLVETRLADTGLRPQVIAQIDAGSTILELVAEGYGHAILSPLAVTRSAMARRLTSRPHRTAAA